MSDEASAPESESVYTQYGGVTMKRRGSRVVPELVPLSPTRASSGAAAAHHGSHGR